MQRTPRSYIQMMIVLSSLPEANSKSSGTKRRRSPTQCAHGFLNPQADIRFPQTDRRSADADASVRAIPVTMQALNSTAVPFTHRPCVLGTVCRKCKMRPLSSRTHIVFRPATTPSRRYLFRHRQLSFLQSPLNGSRDEPCRPAMARRSSARLGTMQCVLTILCVPQAYVRVSHPRHLQTSALGRPDQVSQHRVDDLSCSHPHASRVSISNAERCSSVPLSTISPVERTCLSFQEQFPASRLDTGRETVRR